jgi:hypothetical protein
MVVGTSRSAHGISFSTASRSAFVAKLIILSHGSKVCHFFRRFSQDGQF